jgi:hypothetical protein
VHIVIPNLEKMAGLVGHRFPGGEYRIEHWENFLLSDATGVAPLPNALAHPAHLFHVPISGAGMTIGDLFRLADADRAAPVSIDYYDWKIVTPLREAETYQLDGGITAHDRRDGVDGGPTVDSFTYEIDVSDTDGDLVAHVAFRWHYWRMGS